MTVCIPEKIGGINLTKIESCYLWLKSRNFANAVSYTLNGWKMRTLSKRCLAVSQRFWQLTEPQTNLQTCALNRQHGICKHKQSQLRMSRISWPIGHANVKHVTWIFIDEIYSDLCIGCRWHCDWPSESRCMFQFHSCFIKPQGTIQLHV